MHYLLDVSVHCRYRFVLFPFLFLFLKIYVYIVCRHFAQYQMKFHRFFLVPFLFVFVQTSSDFSLRVMTHSIHFLSIQMLRLNCLIFHLSFLGCHPLFLPLPIVFLRSQHPFRWFRDGVVSCGFMFIEMF